jgi:hypothetical protein
MFLLRWATLLSVITHSFAIPLDGESTKMKHWDATFDYVIVGGGKMAVMIPI